LLLLSARLFGPVNDTAIDSAVLLELLHTASLIHDDVIDETKERRGRPSLNAFFDNRISVLVGDYVLSSALIRSVHTGNFRIMRVVSEVGRALAEGEIKQLETADEVVLAEEAYMQIIRKKTAFLLSASAEIGAISSNASDEAIALCRSFGEFLGYCFQIRDDIFDYYDEGSRLGKPTGNDILEGKVTLPLLYALKKSGAEEAERMRALIERHDYTPEHIRELLDFAKKHGGIDYAYERMHYYYGQAMAVLRHLPETPSRHALEALAAYIIERDR
jgi:octaprenyl-diphosphate synthase